MPAVSEVLLVERRDATRVSRQKGSALKVPLTRIVASMQQFTVKMVPVRAFSGRPPSEGGLNRLSRQVPVQVGVGSIFALACVSLYVTSVRYGVALGSMLGSQRVFQNTSLPLKNARLMPAPRAASTFAR